MPGICWDTVYVNSTHKCKWSIDVQPVGTEPPSSILCTLTPILKSMILIATSVCSFTEAFGDRRVVIYAD